MVTTGRQPPEQENRLDTPERRPLLLLPGEGRAYAMGGIQAVFKADEAETAHRYSVSEWWLEPDTAGPAVA